MAPERDDELLTAADYLDAFERDDVRLRNIPVAESVWLELLERGYSKRSVLLHKRLPLSVLSILASDPDPAVRSAVADKRAAGPLLPALALDDSVRVRGCVARNAKTTRDVLERLALDEAPHVANFARNRLGLPLVPEPDIDNVVGDPDGDT